jgi:hypothetical protein
VINLATLVSYRASTTGDLPYPADYSLSHRLNGNVSQLVAFGGYNHNTKFEFSNDIHTLGTILAFIFSSSLPSFFTYS